MRFYYISFTCPFFALLVIALQFIITSIPTLDLILNMFWQRGTHRSVGPHNRVIHHFPLQIKIDMDHQAKQCKRRHYSCNRGRARQGLDTRKLARSRQDMRRPHTRSSVFGCTISGTLNLFHSMVQLTVTSGTSDHPAVQAQRACMAHSRPSLTHFLTRQRQQVKLVYSGQS